MPNPSPSTAVQLTRKHRVSVLPSFSSASSFLSAAFSFSSLPVISSFPSLQPISSSSLCTTSKSSFVSFPPRTRFRPCFRHASHSSGSTKRRRPTLSNPVSMTSDPTDEQREWVEALEEILVEALRTYYQGTPLFSDAEFNTLRDELEHLGLAQLRLYNVEKVWVQATSARDFDRRMCQEFDLSEDDLRSLKRCLLLKGLVSKPSMNPPQPYTETSGLRTANTNDENNEVTASNIFPMPQRRGKEKEKRDQKNGEMQNISQRSHQQQPLQRQEMSAETSNFDNAEEENQKYLADATEIKASHDVNERIKWFLFSDASEERFKIMLLYLPAVVMSFVTASVLTVLFALLDGEMTITVTNVGRFRLGVLSYVAVALTFWISNRFTPTVLDYLDLGQPSLMRGACPICGSPVSCLFTGAARVRDERKCSMCGAIVAFNRRWQKTYLVSPPGKRVQSPD